MTIRHELGLAYTALQTRRCIHSSHLLAWLWPRSPVNQYLIMSLFYPTTAMDTAADPAPGTKNESPDQASSDDTQAPAAGQQTMPSSYYYTTAPDASTHIQSPTYQRSRSIKSDEGLDLQGPLQIDGSVKSGGSINFNGDFTVRDKIDAYGAINMNGTTTSACVSNICPSGSFCG